MSAKHADRTFATNDNNTCAPAAPPATTRDASPPPRRGLEHPKPRGVPPLQPPECGDLPPAMPTTRAFTKMTARRLDAWLEYARTIKRTIRLVGRPDSLEFRAAMRERALGGLGDIESIEALRARAAMPEQWLPCTLNVMRDDADEYDDNYVMCRSCQGERTVRHFRLYGTVTTICVDCYRKRVLLEQPHDDGRGPFDVMIYTGFDRADHFFSPDELPSPPP